MSNERYAFKDTGEIVPTYAEMLESLGPEFLKISEERLQRLEKTTSLAEALQIGAYLQGLYAAAGALGRLQPQFARAIMRQAAKKTEERLTALGIKGCIEQPHELNAQVH